MITNYDIYMISYSLFFALSKPIPLVCPSNISHYQLLNSPHRCGNCWTSHFGKWRKENHKLQKCNPFKLIYFYRIHRFFFSHLIPQPRIHPFEFKATKSLKGSFGFESIYVDFSLTIIFNPRDFKISILSKPFSTAGWLPHSAPTPSTIDQTVILLIPTLIFNTLKTKPKYIQFILHYPFLLLPSAYTISLLLLHNYNYISINKFLPWLPDDNIDFKMVKKYLVMLVFMCFIGIYIYLV